MGSQITGIVLREDYKLACKIFANAFNPMKIANPNKAPGQPTYVANPNYDPNWDPTSAFKLTQSEIRLEQPLVANNALYNFPIL
jgi:hypothetical protein